MISISARIHSFYNSISNKTEGSPFTRYKSWEYCYQVFKKYREKRQAGNKLTDNDYDYLALNLAFYLASWGMYRGSSFLLQRDYKTHIPAVKEIMKSDYDDLQGFNPHKKSKEKLSTAIENILNLKNKIVNSYQPIDERNVLVEQDKYYFRLIFNNERSKELALKPNADNAERQIVKGGPQTFSIDTENRHVKYKPNRNSEWFDLGFAYDNLDEAITSENHQGDWPLDLCEIINEEPFSDTLSTKILMGTLGCVPAYDRYLKKGLGQSGIVQKFGRNSLCNLFKYVNDYYDEFNIDTNGDYPIMKKADMYFWQYGYELDFLDEDSSFMKLYTKEVERGETLNQKENNSKNKLIAQLRMFINCQSSNLNEFKTILEDRNN